MFRKLLARATDVIAYPVGSIMNRVAMRQSKDKPLERHRRGLATSVDFIQQHMRFVIPAYSQFELLSESFRKADTSSDRLVCEFGVFQGSTVNHLATMTSKMIFGFDSFEGLPEAWLSVGAKKGHFAVKKLPVVRKNVTLVKGWFDETLPAFLEQNQGMIGFLHIDCDLYSSTKIVFDLLKPRLAAGAVIVFDEYFNHPEWQQDEHKAFNEFLANTGLSCEYMGYNCMGEQLAVKLK
jgi:Macrocin-O-methyltransferase (TylF)